MRLLLVGPAHPTGYSVTLLRNVQRALDRIGIDWAAVDQDQPLEGYRGFDLYVGVGDELFRKNPGLVQRIKAIGGVTADFRTRFLPLKPKTWAKYALTGRSEKVDYAFTHFRSWHPRGLYVGQGVNDDLLYPGHDAYFTVLVDHYMHNRHACVQDILDQCAELQRTRKNVRIWYHSKDGIVENRFGEDRGHPANLPFPTIAAYYRKTHVFLPTHRETQGMVAAEIGMCGGITLVRPWMYRQGPRRPDPAPVLSEPDTLARPRRRRAEPRSDPRRIQPGSLRRPAGNGNHCHQATAASDVRPAPAAGTPAPTSASPLPPPSSIRRRRCRARWRASSRRR